MLGHTALFICLERCATFVHLESLKNLVFDLKSTKKHGQKTNFHTLYHSSLNK